MKKILVFAGSNSKASINKQLAVFAGQQLANSELTTLDLNDFDLPLYGIDLENDSGIPQAAHDFLAQIRSCDGIILSLAEHNGAYSTAFKNVFDWMSRIDGKLWSEKPMLLMASSPGGRGGSSVLEIASKRFPYMGGNVVATFSLPKFNEHFSEDGIREETLAQEFSKAMEAFHKSLID